LLRSFLIVTDHGVRRLLPSAIVRRIPIVALAVLLLTGACGGDDEPGAAWSVVHENLPGALLSVWGASAEDVYAVGGDSGDGPMVIHWDGSTWHQLDTGESGDLWWVYGFAGGPIYMGGKDGLLLRLDGDTFTRMTTPGGATIFGLWGSSASDMLAVGGAEGGASGGFAWHLVGEEWQPVADFPADIATTGVVWKVYGRSASDVWMVGTNGLAVRGDGNGYSEENLGTGESIFTVHANGERFVAVGGFGTGTILENDGTSWTSVAPPGAPALNGVCLTDGDRGYAVGAFGAVMERSAAGWSEVDTGLALQDSLHAVWVDPDGGVWAVGGQVSAYPLVRGQLIYKGAKAPLGELQ
jgi:hypothetical protein